MAVRFRVRTGLAASAFFAMASGPLVASADPTYDCGGSGIIADSNSDAVISTNGRVQCVYTYDATATLGGQLNPAVPEGAFRRRGHFPWGRKLWLGTGCIS